MSMGEEWHADDADSTLIPAALDSENQRPIRVICVPFRRIGQQVNSGWSVAAKTEALSYARIIN
jgi:hypothetical protein